MENQTLKTRTAFTEMLRKVWERSRNQKGATTFKQLYPGMDCGVLQEQVKACFADARMATQEEYQYKSFEQWLKNNYAVNDEDLIVKSVTLLSDLHRFTKMLQTVFALARKKFTPGVFKYEDVAEILETTEMGISGYDAATDLPHVTAAFLSARLQKEGNYIYEGFEQYKAQVYTVIVDGIILEPNDEFYKKCCLLGIKYNNQSDNKEVKLNWSNEMAILCYEVDGNEKFRGKLKAEYTSRYDMILGKHIVTSGAVSVWTEQNYFHDKEKAEKDGKSKDDLGWQKLAQLEPEQLQITHSCDGITREQAQQYLGKLLLSFLPQYRAEAEKAAAENKWYEQRVRICALAVRKAVLVGHSKIVLLSFGTELFLDVMKDMFVSELPLYKADENGTFLHFSNNSEICINPTSLFFIDRAEFIGTDIPMEEYKSRLLATAINSEPLAISSAKYNIDKLMQENDVSVVDVVKSNKAKGDKAEDRHETGVKHLNALASKSGVQYSGWESIDKLGEFQKEKSEAGCALAGREMICKDAAGRVYRAVILLKTNTDPLRPYLVIYYRLCTLPNNEKTVLPKWVELYRESCEGNGLMETQFNVAVKVINLFTKTEDGKETAEMPLWGDKVSAAKPQPLEPKAPDVQAILTASELQTLFMNLLNVPLENLSNISLHLAYLSDLIRKGAKDPMLFDAFAAFKNGNLGAQAAVCTALQHIERGELEQAVKCLTEAVGGGKKKKELVPLHLSWYDAPKDFQGYRNCTNAYWARMGNYKAVIVCVMPQNEDGTLCERKEGVPVLIEYYQLQQPTGTENSDVPAVWVRTETDEVLKGGKLNLPLFALKSIAASRLYMLNDPKSSTFKGDATKVLIK